MAKQKYLLFVLGIWIRIAAGLRLNLPAFRGKTLQELSGRRRFLDVLVVATATAGPGVALADPIGELGSKLLTSKTLEKARIAGQRNRDNIEFDADSIACFELPCPSGSALTQPVMLLVPIAVIEATLVGMQAAISTPESWESLRSTLTSGPFETKAFKKIFNDFADNIYYSASESDRANAYLGGGAVSFLFCIVPTVLRRFELTPCIFNPSSRLHQVNRQPSTCFGTRC